MMRSQNAALRGSSGRSSAKKLKPPQPLRVFAKLTKNLPLHLRRPFPRFSDEFLLFQRAKGTIQTPYFAGDQFIFSLRTFPLPTMEDILKALPADGASVMANVAPHLSRHLLFPLIQFEGDQAEEKGDSELAKKILSGKIKLLEDTNMTDYVATLYCDLHGVAEPPAEYIKKRQDVLTQLDKYEKETEQIANLLTQDEVVNGLRSDKVANLEFLKNQHGVGAIQGRNRLG